MLLQKRARPILLCKICGDIARGMNFDVLTCMSCKAFFRRNALRSSETRHCQVHQQCIINVNSRSRCPSCRLDKCFRMGMNPFLIRAINMKTDQSFIANRFIDQQANYQVMPSPRTIDLLFHGDRSTLTTDQWTLLSNIIRSYDQQNLIERIRRSLDEKASLPVKLRSKAADTLQLISEPMRLLLPLVQQSSHYQQLSGKACQLLQMNNIFFTGAVNGYFVARETDAFNNPIYMTACSALYGDEYMLKCAEDNRRLEPNGNLIKLFLFALIFSSNCSLVAFDPRMNSDESTSKLKRSTTLELVGMQDIYVTMLWKYMVYLYGQDRAVIRYASMIKSVTDMFRRVEDLPSESASINMMSRLFTDDAVVSYHYAQAHFPMAMEISVKNKNVKVSLQ